MHSLSQQNRTETLASESTLPSRIKLKIKLKDWIDLLPEVFRDAKIRQSVKFPNFEYSDISRIRAALAAAVGDTVVTVN